MVKIAHLAEAFRMKFAIHHGGNSLNNVANLHVTMAIPNCEYFEVFPARRGAETTPAWSRTSKSMPMAWSTHPLAPASATRSTGRW